MVIILTTALWAGIAQSVWRLATCWTFRGSNPGGGEIFRTGPERPWGRVSLVGIKRPGRGVVHPPPYSAEVKERVYLCPYNPSGFPWRFLG